MSQINWENDKMLDVYIHDYLKKRNLPRTVAVFLEEAKLPADRPVAIDAPRGFLLEWWNVFWDIFITRTEKNHSEAASKYLEMQQMKAGGQKLRLMQQHRAQLQRTNPNHPSLNGLMNATCSDVMTLTTSNHPGQLVQGNPGGGYITLQQIQDMHRERNSGVAQRYLPVDPSSIYGQGIIHAKSGLGGAGLNQGASGIPLEGCPLTGVNQLRTNLGAQMQKSFPSPQTQLQLLTTQQQQQLAQAQAQAQGTLGNFNYRDSDPRRFRTFPRGSLNGKDGQPSGTDVSMGSPVHTTSPKTQMQQSFAQQPQDQLEQQQLQQNNGKRKKPTSPGAANIFGTGNTVVLSPNSLPSTQSIHTTRDGVVLAKNVQHVHSMPKNSVMYDADGMGGLASSPNQMDDLEHFYGADSFLLNDDGNARDRFSTLKRSIVKHNTESSKDSFNEVGCIRTSNGKVLCCHFSSDGKLLASAGYEKKAVLWNMGTLQTESTPQEHTSTISDICFRPNSTQLATSSFDKTVRLWNAEDPSSCMHTYNGHSSGVTSLDFHPKKTDLFCSCDDNGEIRFWSVIQHSCSRLSKGGTVRVRFQPRIGQCLAAAEENVVSIFDVETDRKMHSFEGDGTKAVCWDANGDLLASVCKDSVKVWSLASGECIHQLSSNGSTYRSCIFHPSYSSMLVIGGYQSLELWNFMENRTMTVQAHECFVAGLAQSPMTGMVASASHDKSVKLWK